MPDSGRVLLTRALRGFADGIVSVILAGYLLRLGFRAVEVGAIVTATMLGSAALTIAVGLFAHRLDSRRLLLAACLLMFGTGLGFAGIERFWPLLVVAVVGTLNPSNGDVSVFLPLEQATLAQSAPNPVRRTALFAWYNVAYVMAVVPPEERAAAASLTNVPRSLAAALPPLLTGMMLERTTLGWPLICAGLLKAIYDVALLLRFRAVAPQ
jgi:MFS family permease